MIKPNGNKPVIRKEKVDPRYLMLEVGDIVRLHEKESNVSSYQKVLAMLVGDGHIQVEFEATDKPAFGFLVVAAIKL